jgi:hypothetical protein
MGKAAELIAAGYEAGSESIPALQALIDRVAEQPRWYQFGRKKKPKEPLELPG